MTMGGATGAMGVVYNVPALLRPVTRRGYNRIHIRLQHLEILLCTVCYYSDTENLT